MPGKGLMPDTEEADVDIGIILALKEEFTELVQDLGGTYQARHDLAGNSYYYLFSSPTGPGGRSWRCAATFIGEMGPVQAGLATRQFIINLRPRILVLLGIAGALGDQLCLGDVVVADQVDAYLENSRATGTAQGDAYFISFSGQAYRCSADLVNVARHFEFAHPQLYLAWREQCERELALLFPEESVRQLQQGRLIRATPAIFEGHLASGPVVAASRAYIDQLRARDRHYLAVDMEAAGLLAAASAQANPVHTLVLRAMSDYADERKATLDAVQEGALRRYAIHNAVQLLWRFVEADLPLAVSLVARTRAAMPEHVPDQSPQAPVRLLYLYAARDHAFRQQIALALAPLLSPGGLVVRQQECQLAPHPGMGAQEPPPVPEAEIVVALLSPDLLADEHHPQLSEVLARHRAQATRVVPVLVRQLAPGRSPFAGIAVVPANGQAVSEWASRPQALLDVAWSIYHVLEAFRPSSA